MSLDTVLELVGNCFYGGDAPFYIDTLRPASYYKNYVPDTLHNQLDLLEDNYVVEAEEYVGIGVEAFHAWVAQLIHCVDPEFSVVPGMQIKDLAEEWWMTRADMMCGIMDSEN